MRWRARFFFGCALVLVPALSLNASLLTGRIYALKFVDIDGHPFSTAEGRITVLVLTAATDTAKASAVGDRVPDRCLANPNYRMVTVLNLSGAYSRRARPLATWFIRRRLSSEGKRLQKRYDAKKISRDARRDIFAVADFDGTVTAQLGAKTGSSDFRVFVFGRDGKLLRQWNDVPSAEDLDAALR